MDVLEKDIRGSLLDVLTSIANATFIAIDMEMTGMAGHLGPRGEKPDMQSYYTEIRNAAEKFQVVQFGITCVEPVKDKGLYIARPYNIYVSPQVLLQVNKGEMFTRTSSMQSSTMAFLIRNGMDFGKVLNQGVMYLSETDEQVLRRNRKNFETRNATREDIVFGPGDDEAIVFLGDVEKKAKAWMDEPLPKSDYVNIDLPSKKPLNGLQKRIVHQVASKYEGYHAKVMSKGAFMQIQRVWPLEEAYHQNKRDRIFESDILKQKGLTWIFKALTGGDLTGLEPRWFHDHNSEEPEHQLPYYEKKIEELSTLLRCQDRALIGHNMFGDLCFMYNMFVGPLPEKFENFRRNIHQLFPFVIDTKYMATEAGNSMSPESNLAAALEPYKKIHTPLLCLHEKFTAYGPSCKKEHEAGFDSWMTMELFIKLSADLFSKTPEGKEALQEELQAEANDKASNSRKPKITSGNIQRNLRPHAIEISNPYAALASLSNSAPSAASTAPITGGRQIPQWLPPTHSIFWDKYSDKLRINRCVDGMCDLSERVDDPDSELEDKSEGGSAGGASSEYFSCGD